MQRCWLGTQGWSQNRPGASRPGSFCTVCGVNLDAHCFLLGKDKAERGSTGSNEKGKNKGSRKEGWSEEREDERKKRVWGEKTKQHSNRMSRREEEGKGVIRGRLSRNGNQEGNEKCSVLLKEEEKTEKMGIDVEREGAEQQCPDSVRWRQARWLQGTGHPAKYGHQDPALSYFL